VKEVPGIVAAISWQPGEVASVAPYPRAGLKGEKSTKHSDDAYVPVPAVGVDTVVKGFGGALARGTAVNE
jgi:hypothetical protein